MKVPRDLSGAQLIKVLSRDWAYRQLDQEGSHVILETATPSHQRLSAHKGVDRQAVLDSLR